MFEERSEETGVGEKVRQLVGVGRSNLYLRDGRLPDGSGTGRSDFQVKRIMSSSHVSFPRL